MRAATGLMLSFAVSLPAHAQSFVYDSSTGTYVVSPGNYSGQASLTSPSSFNALNQGNITFSTNPSKFYALSLGASNGSGNYSSGGFTFTNQGSVTITAPSSDTGTNDFRILDLYALAGNGSSGNSPTPGGSSGPITLNLGGTVSLNSQIPSFAHGAYAVWMQSIGSAGGGSDKSGVNGSYGNNVGAITANITGATVSVQVVSAADGAAIHTEQTGGQGGKGDKDGKGGQGGTPQLQTITLTDSRLTTGGDNIAGLVLRQIGGRGGDGDIADREQNSSGGDGAPTKGINLTFAQGSGSGNVISTNGANAPAVSVRAEGGAGGTGAETGGGLQFDSIGGNGGRGETPGTITVNSTGTQSITTSGGSSAGIVLVSQGGTGGNGGVAESLGGGHSGSGGNGGGGGGIQANINGAMTIRTTGDESSGFVAQSTGGVGGVGAVGSSNFGIGSGNGGSGGAGGFVNVTLGSGTTINTSGSDSHGVVAQSVGAQGGLASKATGLISDGGNGGTGGSSSGLYLSNNGTIGTTGLNARGILAQSISGDGGTGGDADALFGDAGAGGAPGSILTMTVLNAGRITTAGAGAQGILAQSIGGGGGAGGAASGQIFNASGGAGLVGAAGGAVVVTSSGTITTGGAVAAGILAQSIGGGGGDGGTGNSVFGSSGGSGGAGGAGGAVNATVGGAITTAGGLSHGLIAQSIGGGGGNGGNSSSSGTVAAYSVGGSGGGGGAGGAVTVTSQGVGITTTGSGADGILAQSIGGGGGSGGGANATSAGLLINFAAAIGGSGGSGGAGGAVAVNLGNTTITTGNGGGAAPPVDSIGILAQSIGGGGGSGGGANALSYAISPPAPPEGPNTFAISAAYSSGGKGGSGGSGGGVTVNLGAGTGGTSGGATVQTAGAGSVAVMAQSIGGGGGQGGDSSSLAGTIGSTSEYGVLAGDTVSVDVSIAVGATGGSGGNGGQVNVNAGAASTPVQVITTGDYAFGLVGQSIGGGGGNAGVGSASYSFSGKTENHRLTVGVGATGGTGGTGGSVSMNLANTTTVQTSGSGAIGVLAQSIGGGGGASTGTTVGIGEIASFSKKNAEGEEGPFKGTLAINVSVGSQGGSGGAGGTASLDNQGRVTTIGNDAPALVVQSVGGGGGVGGSAGNDAEDAQSEDDESTQAALAGSRARGGGSLAAVSSNPFNPNITFETELNLSVGGKGGSAGDGGTVTLQHGGQVTTSGDYAPGLVAQSIGGGGGRGGTAVAGGEGNSLSSIVDTGIVKSNVSLGASGGGGTGGSGGNVTLNLDGGAAVTTGLAGQGSMGTGVQSIGILGQSIGGGGGTGADGTVQPNGDLFLGAGLAGGGGASGSAGQVWFRQSSGGNAMTVTTYGESGHGIVLQSIGAGGGVAGAGSTLAGDVPVFSGLDVGLKLGGSSGSSGNGGTVLVDNPILNLSTSGMGAYGLIAQSIGAGGGIANVIGSPATLTGLGGGGGSGNGGSVTVNLPFNSTISTTGLGAHAVVAQSVGGGGGIATGYQAGVTPSLTGPPAFGSSSGDGGDVSVNARGTITTTGDGAFGIIAQSVGRGGGLATIGGTSYAASMGGNGSTGFAGRVEVDLQGVVSATGENSVGVFAQSVNGQGVGADEVLVNVGGTGIATIVGGGGQGSGIWVESGNSGNTVSISQGSSVSALSNVAIQYTGAFGVNVNNAGTLVGSASIGNGTLTNSSTMLVSLPGTGRAVIDGDFVQTSTGRVAVTTDFAAGRSGNYLVTGDARLAGMVLPTLTTIVGNVRVPVITVQGQVTGELSVASTALFDFEVERTRTASGKRFDLVATGSRFDDSQWGLSPGQRSFASHLDEVFAAGSPRFGAFFAYLDRTAGESPAEFARTLGQLSPRSALAVGAQRAQDGAFIANASMSCPVFAAPSAFLTEGSCFYARVGGRTTSVDGDVDRGRLKSDSTTFQFGGQGELSPSWFLGGSLAYETGSLNANDGVKGDADAVHGALTLKRQEGPWLFTGAIFGSIGDLDIERNVNVPGFGGVAKSSPVASTVGGRARAAYTIASDNLYVRPFLNVDLIHARIGAHSERGLGAFGLRYDVAEQTNAVFTPALEVGSRMDLGTIGVLRSFLSAGVDIRTEDQWKATARLIGAPAGGAGFTTIVPQDRAAARVSAGLQLFTMDRIDLRAQYDGSYSEQTTTHGGMLTFSYRM